MVEPDRERDEAVGPDERERDPASSEMEPAERSEGLDADRAPQPEQLRNWNRDELLERAAELGLDVDPEISREALVDKLSRDTENR